MFRSTPVQLGGGEAAFGDDEDASGEPSRAGPPPLPWGLRQPASFEREVSIDGFRLSPDPGALLPPFLAVDTRTWISSASDARLTGLGWTETLALDRGLYALRWAVSGRWAPPALSARPATVGLSGPVVADAVEGPASAPHGAWRASGSLGGPLASGRLGAVLSVEASGVGLPATEPGLAGGGRARQVLALTTTWLPGAQDRLSLLVLAGRRTESPDCFRCTDAAARVDREVAGLAGFTWEHVLAPGAGLALRLSAEHRNASASARAPSDEPGRLDLSTWISDAAPGPLSPDLGSASTLEASSTRLQLSTNVHALLGAQRLEGGLEGRLDTEARALSIPSGTRFLDRGSPCRDGDPAGCAFRIDVDPVQTASRGWNLAAWLEDALRLGDLGLRAGVRLEAGQAGADAVTTGLRLGIGPRLSLAWNLAGEGRHWLVLHAGRSHDTELEPVVARAVLPSERVRAWGDGAFDDCAGHGPGCVRLGGPAVLAPGGFPSTDEVALGWRGHPARGLEGGLEARWRRTSGLWTEGETGLPTDERGQWTSTDGAWTSRRTLAADGRAWRQALGLDLWARARLGPTRLAATWSVARVTGTAAGPFDTWLSGTRTAALASGPLPDDRRHRVRLSIALLAHPAVELGLRLRYATGGPLWETFSVSGSPALRTVRGARGTGVLGSVEAALRDPDVFAADAWVRLRLGRLFRQTLPRLDLTVEAAQVAGGNTPVHLSASAARLGAVLRREPPFQLVLGLRAGD
jgi:hypothetical protein